ADEIEAVHQPDRRRAVVAPPQDVGLAVVVVVAGALDVPARPRIERTRGAPQNEVAAEHQPDRGRAVAPLPQDVGQAVAVGVGRACERPARPRIETACDDIMERGINAVHEPERGRAVICQLGPGLNEPAPPTKTVLRPFISQIAGSPSLRCHRMSLKLLPLKSSGFTTVLESARKNQLARLQVSMTASSVTLRFHVEPSQAPPKAEAKVAEPPGAGWLMGTLPGRPTPTQLASVSGVGES